MKTEETRGHLAMLGANTMWGLMAPISKFVLTGSVITPLLLITGGKQAARGEAGSTHISSGIFTSDGRPINDKDIIHYLLWVRCAISTNGIPPTIE